MSYSGYVPLVKHYLANLQHAPSVLEVGTDTGATFIPLLVFLTRVHQEFLLAGIDIKIHESLKMMTRLIDVDQQKHNVYLIEENSLVTLPKLCESNVKFDVILLDGDHNYFTVAKELEIIPKLLNDYGLLIIDDFDGRWSEKDLWYSTRDGYEQNAIATKPTDTEKHGVKAAVEEFLATHDTWQLSKPITGEAVILTRKV